MQRWRGRCRQASPRPCETLGRTARSRCACSSRHNKISCWTAGVSYCLAASGKSDSRAWANRMATGSWPLGNFTRDQASAKSNHDSSNDLVLMTNFAAACQRRTYGFRRPSGASASSGIAFRPRASSNNILWRWPPFSGRACTIASSIRSSCDIEDTEDTLNVLSSLCPPESSVSHARSPADFRSTSEILSGR